MGGGNVRVSHLFHICVCAKTVLLIILSSDGRPNGVRFKAPAGTTEFAKRWNPQPGDIVSFKHRGTLLGTKIPKAPMLYRMRSDMKWEDVLANWKENKFSQGK